MFSRKSRLLVFSFFAAFLLFGTAPARANERPDAYIAGYISSVLENEMGWSHSEYSINVRDAMVTVRTTRNGSDRGAAHERIARIQGLRRITIVAGEGSDPIQPGLLENFVERTLGISSDLVYFPPADVFRPLVADPKEPSFYLSLRHYDSKSVDGTVGAAGYGGTFGLIRNPGRRPGDGFQIGLGGGLFALFDLEEPSTDLINADYTIALPLTYRSGWFSTRLRLYHQSSHLGDEFVLKNSAPRINLSFESIELLVAADLFEEAARVYAGGEYLYNRDPSSFDPGVLTAGVDIIGNEVWLGVGRPLVAAGVKALQENDWDAGLTVRTGVQFGTARSPERTLRLLLEYFTGHNPNGQFYQDQTDYLGAGLYLGF
jgi:hypothetical protein